jgi:hypothetical protein
MDEVCVFAEDFKHVELMARVVTREFDADECWRAPGCFSILTLDS